MRFSFMPSIWFLIGIYCLDALYAALLLQNSFLNGSVISWRIADMTELNWPAWSILPLLAQCTQRVCCSRWDIIHFWWQYRCHFATSGCASVSGKSNFLFFRFWKIFCWFLWEEILQLFLNFGNYQLSMIAQAYLSSSARSHYGH